MYRNLYKNKYTGELTLLWESYDKEEKDYILSRDLLAENRVKADLYEEVPDENDDRMPFNLFGIECGKGWYGLIQPIIKWIDNYNQYYADDNKIEVLQIKEKWGLLRIEISHGTKELFDMIAKAEEESAHICEFCGTREHIGQTQGYYMTICHDCIKEMSKDRNFGSYMWHSYDDDKTYWINPDGTEEEVSDKDKEDLA